MHYRRIYVALALVAVAAITLGVVFGKGGEPVRLPDPIEAVFPLPGDAVIRQTSVEVDMAPGYTARISVDGFLLPSSEVSYVEATGVYRWSPSPTSVYMTQWAPGVHHVHVAWNRQVGLADVGEFDWDFRVQ